MLTGSQLSVLQKAGRTEVGVVAQLKALHYAATAKVFSLLCLLFFFNHLFSHKASVAVTHPLESK